MFIAIFIVIIEEHMVLNLRVLNNKLTIDN